MMYSRRDPISSVTNTAAVRFKPIGVHGVTVTPFRRHAVRITMSQQQNVVNLRMFANG